MDYIVVLWRKCKSEIDSQNRVWSDGRKIQHRERCPTRLHPVSFVAHRCSPLPILSLSGVDRHDCLLPCFSVLCELWVELVLSQIAPHSVHPPQSGPTSRSLPSHLHRCYLLCNMSLFSPHHMAIPRKAFLGDICGDWLDHCIAPELFISVSVFPRFALNPS